MKIEQGQWSEKGWSPALPAAIRADLVFVFGARDALASSGVLQELRDAYPDATMVGCSTAGEIRSTRVHDDTIVVTAVSFDHTRVTASCMELSDQAGCYDVGRGLAEALGAEDLTHVFAFSDGLSVNGSELVSGLTARLPRNVSVTGGLSGDGSRFEKTLVVWDGKAEPGRVVAVGLHGPRLEVGYASLGGWDPFGPDRVVTRSKGNVVYEFDGKSALDLYKQYLGDQAEGLPATGLLFPISMRRTPGDTPLVRTILGVDEVEQSLTFAGDVPEGSQAQLMKANFDRLIEGAVGAARQSAPNAEGVQPELALLISCVGRKLVLKQRIEEEVEAVRNVLGSSPVLMGFYSYGEISPFTANARCELHNQTMTITTISERAA